MGVLEAKPPKTSEIFHFNVPKTAVDFFVWFSVYFSPNYKSIQIPIEQNRFNSSQAKALMTNLSGKFVYFWQEIGHNAFLIIFLFGTLMIQ